MKIELNKTKKKLKNKKLKLNYLNGELYDAL